MEKGSRLRLKHQFWFEDLPRQDELRSVDPDISDDFNVASNEYLEVSRHSTYVRGPLFLVSAIVTPIMLWLGWFILSENVSEGFSEGFLVVAVFLVVWLLLLAQLVFGFRFDIANPKDRPVRFNRKQRKIYAYEYKWTWNPLGRWPTTVKVFDWDNVQAEITLQRGFSGKVYVERYALSLAHCRPGIDEVIDRFDLRGNAVLTHGLRAMWSYCCQYMAHGPDDLPKSTPRPQDIRFLRCLFYFMPWFEPTREGSEYRRIMHWVTWLLALITLPVVPFLLLFGLSNYVVMRLAPEPKWPVEIDAASRSANG